MQQIGRFVNPLLLIAAMIFPIAGSGCAARVRYYDAKYHDYHRWDPSESRAYQEYWAERGKQYREWTDLNEHEQGEYWEWRHAHPWRY
jgi:hypothetical protein